MNPLGQRTALVVGATGLVGGCLLKGLVNDDAYSTIATLGRRAPDIAHDRITHHVHDVLTDAPMQRADVLFCCLGTTIKRAGSQKAFRAIDHDLVVALAEQAAKQGTDTFIVVSSVGADSESGNFYLRTKGEMEHAVQHIGFTRLGILRPSLLLGGRDDFRPAELAGQYAARLLNPLLFGSFGRYRAVDAKIVAAAMIGFDLASTTGTQILEGADIPRIAS